MQLGDYNSIDFELGIRDTRGIAANFHRADAEIEDAMVSLVGRYTDILDRVWESLTPVDKGFMVAHRHIRITRSGLGFEAGWDAADFFDAGLAFYPVFVEFGTSRMAAQPSLGPAYEYITPLFQADMRDVIRGAIQRLEGSAQ